MEQVMKCDNCTWRGNYREANPAQRLHSRLDLGGIYTDVECPECEALVYLIKPVTEAACNQQGHGTVKLKLRTIAAHQIEITLASGAVIFFSYQMPVAASIPGRGYIRAGHQYSATTRHHISRWRPAGWTSRGGNRSAG